MVEIKAFLGLLYLIGVQKQNHVDIEELWSPEFGSNLFRLVMSRNRFVILSCNLRFDDKETRAHRKKSHGLAPIKEIWDIFIEKCKKLYKPSHNCTIDEQLLSFRGRFKGKVYIPKKPVKYGIKIVCINDVQTSYMFDAEPYAGKGPWSKDNSAFHYLTTLSESIRDSSRNITCDNWFTQVKSVQHLKKNLGVTTVGTIRKNKPEIPPLFTKKAEPGTARFAYAEGMTLLSWCPKKNKVVLLLSSLHKAGYILKDQTKPEIVDFYNKTKNGTDTFDQICKNYTTARVSKRWPMRLFYGMLDQAGVNSNILLNLSSKNKEKLYRRDYLKALGLALVQPHLAERLKQRNIPNTLKIRIREILGENTTHDEPEEIIIKTEKRKRCQCNKLTIWICSKCHVAACDDHRIHLCFNCK